MNGCHPAQQLLTSHEACHDAIDLNALRATAGGVLLCSLMDPRKDNHKGAAIRTARAPGGRPCLALRIVRGWFTLSPSAWLTGVAGAVCPRHRAQRFGIAKLGDRASCPARCTVLGTVQQCLPPGYRGEMRSMSTAHRAKLPSVAWLTKLPNRWRSKNIRPLSTETEPPGRSRKIGIDYVPKLQYNTHIDSHGQQGGFSYVSSKLQPG